MFKRWKNNQAALKLLSLLESKKNMPNELTDVVAAIMDQKPKSASDNFKNMLKEKLKKEHQKLYATKAKEEKEEVQKASLFDGLANFFQGKKWAVSLASLLIVLLIGGSISYALVPAPQVVRGAVKEEGVVEIASNAPIKVTFTGLMDKSSVEDAFKIEPKINGRFEWNRNVLSFFPETPFKVGDTYKVIIGTEAKSLWQKHLQLEYSENFLIIGPPQVSLFTPADKNMVEPDSKITVMFDRTMTSLTSLKEGEKNAVAIKFEPEITGRFKWLGTSSFQFIPEKLIPATHYKVTIPKGTLSADGGSLIEDFVSEFDTTHPQIMEIFPTNKSVLNGPTTNIELNFNQKINLDVIGGHFNFYKYKGTIADAENFINKSENNTFINSTEALKDQFITDANKWELNPGTFSYKKIINEDKTEKTEETIIVFKPNTALNFESYYKIDIGSGLMPAEGNIPLKEGGVTVFKTVGKPKVVFSSPTNGTENYSQYNVSVEFSNPMNLESLQKNIKQAPEQKDDAGKVKIPDLYLDNNGTRMDLYYNYLPSTKFTITIPKIVQDEFGQQLPEDLVISFKTAKINPNFYLITKTNPNIVDVNYPPLIYVKSTNVNKIKFLVKEVPLEEFEKKFTDGYVSLYDGNTFDMTGAISFEKNMEPKLDKTMTTEINLGNELNKTIKPGIYYVEASSDEVKNQWDNLLFVNRELYIFTKYALTYKYAQGQIVAWATDLKDGQPVSDMEISVKKNVPEVVATGKTDSQGLVEIKVDEGKENYYSSPFWLLGKKGSDFTLVANSWNDGINAWNFNLNYRYKPERYFSYVYTDRPIYRPGHKVYFKGIIRVDAGTQFQMPNSNMITVEIRDSEDQEIYKKAIGFSPTSGAFWDEFELAKEAKLGNYTIRAYFDDIKREWQQDFSASFYVTEYRKPDFRLDLEPAKKEYINGEKAEVKVKAAYYFGAPLSNADYSYAVTSQDYYFNQYEGKWYSFSDDGNLCYFGCQGSAGIVLEGTGKVDAYGEAKLTIPLELVEKKLSQFYTVEVRAIGLNNQEVANRITIPVHKGEYYVGIRNDEWVAAKGKETTFDIISVDFAGKPVANKNLMATFYKRVWNTVKKKNVDGGYYYENTYEDIELGKKAGVTDDSGKAKIPFTPGEGGVLRAVVTSQDPRGNKILAGTEIYVTSSDSYINWGRENNDQIELVPDKPEYQLGETAKILIKSPYEKVKALVTYERQNILEKKVIDVTSNSFTLEVPVKAEFQPNVFVSVVMVKGGGENATFKKESLDKTIKDKEELIAKNETTITKKEEELAQIKTLYTEPEEIAKYENPIKEEMEKLKTETEQAKIEVNDAKKALEEIAKIDTKAKKENNPDAGIAAFKVGYATLHLNTDNKQLVIDLKPDKERYHPGDEVKMKIKTMDPAGKGRKAELSLAVVDESVLALRENVMADLIKIFYRDRDISVSTAQTLVNSIMRINVVAAEGAKGGGGALWAKRENFKDTAFWQAHIETDDNGNAEVTFKLPDNLTSFEALAIGLTNDTLVGSKKMSFKVAKDLMITPVLPRFLITKDTLKIGAVVHNGTTKDITSKVHLQAKGVTMLDSAAKELTINPDSEQKVEWEISVNAENEASFDFLIESYEMGDEVEMKLPIYPYSFPEVVATSGIIQDDKGLIEKIVVPSDVSSELGELTVTVAPTLAAGIAKGIEFLVTYPYGCTEQTISSLLPNLIVKQVLSLPAITNKFIDLKDLDDKVSKGLQRLYQFQNVSGGYGLWENSETSGYLTSYVLFAFNEAKKAGYNVDQNVINKALAYLNDLINKTPLVNEQKKDIKGYISEIIGNNSTNLNGNNSYAANTRAYILYVLSELNKPDIGLVNNLYDFRDNLSLYSKAYLLMTYDNAVKKGNLEEATKTAVFGKMKTLRDDIVNRQKASPRGVHFEEHNLDHRMFESDIKTTALVFEALVRTDINNPVIPKTLKYLLWAKKNNGAWQSTQETVNALMALIDYLKQSTELNPAFLAAVNINQEKKAEMTFGKDNIAEKISTQTAVKDLLTKGLDNEVKIVHNGSGNLYYDIIFRYFLPTEKVESRSEGLQVTQEYFDLADEKEEKPLNSLNIATNYKVKLTLLVPEDRYFVSLDDRLPAGLEGVDFELKTSAQIIKTKGEAASQPQNCNNAGEGMWCDPYSYDRDYFNHKEYRDDRVVYFADYLPKGVYEIYYYVRTTATGTFHDLPTLVSEMYFPEIFGRTEGKMVTVK